jgi:hypothetical protein
MEKYLNFLYNFMQPFMNDEWHNGNAIEEQMDKILYNYFISTRELPRKQKKLQRKRLAREYYRLDNCLKMNEQYADTMKIAQKLFNFNNKELNDAIGIFG